MLSPIYGINSRFIYYLIWFKTQRTQMKYLYLSLAIVLEVMGSSYLNASDGFSKWLPATIAITSYTICFYFLSLAFKFIPLGIAYAVWAGMGIILTALVSVYIFKQTLSLQAIVGIFLILVGVFLMNYDDIVKFS